MPVILGIECDDSVTAQSSLRPLERVKGPLGSHLNRFVTVSFLVHATVTRRFQSPDTPFPDPTRVADDAFKPLLGYHVIDGSIAAADVTPALPSPTRARRPLVKSGGFVTADDAVVQRAGGSGPALGPKCNEKGRPRAAIHA